MEAGKGMTLPTKKLVQTLKDLDDRENEVDNVLDRLNVPTVKVSFERLFLAGKDVEEWLRVFRFLGTGPTNLTASDVEKAGHAATSIPFHNITLSNYEEVRSALNGTKFADLLR